MMHIEPRLQELAEIIQGALQRVTDRRITWKTCWTSGGWILTCAVLPDAARDCAWAVTFTISHDSLTTVNYWDNVKSGILAGIARRFFFDAPKAEERDVTWISDVDVRDMGRAKQIEVTSLTKAELERYGPCVICGTSTPFACSDCCIDMGDTMYVCSSAACRDKHEAVCSGKEHHV